MRRTRTQGGNRLDRAKADARQNLNQALEELIETERKRAAINAFREAAKMALALPRGTPEQDSAALDLYARIKAKAEEISRSIADRS